MKATFRVKHELPDKMSAIHNTCKNPLDFSGNEQPTDYRNTNTILWDDCCNHLKSIVIRLLSDKITPLTFDGGDVDMLQDQVLQHICDFIFCKNPKELDDIESVNLFRDIALGSNLIEHTANHLGGNVEKNTWIHTLYDYYHKISNISNVFRCDKIYQDDIDYIGCVKCHIQFLQSNGELIELLEQMLEKISRENISTYTILSIEQKNMILEYCEKCIRLFGECKCSPMVELRTFYENFRKDNTEFNSVEGSGTNRRWSPSCDCHIHKNNIDLVFKSVSFWDLAMNDAHHSFSSIRQKSNVERTLLSDDDLRLAYFYKCKKYSNKSLSDFDSDHFGPEWLDIVRTISTGYYELYWDNMFLNDASQRRVSKPRCVLCKAEYIMRDPTDLPLNIKALEYGSNNSEIPTTRKRVRNKGYQIIDRFLQLIQSILYDSYDKLHLKISKSADLKMRSTIAFNTLFESTQYAIGYRNASNNNVQNTLDDNDLKNLNSRNFLLMINDYSKIVPLSPIIDSEISLIVSIFGKEIENIRDDYNGNLARSSNYGKMVLDILWLVCKTISSMFVFSDFTLYAKSEAVGHLCKNLQTSGCAGDLNLMVEMNNYSDITSDEYQALYAHIYNLSNFFNVVEPLVGTYLKKTANIVVDITESFRADLLSINNISGQLETMKKFDALSRSIISKYNDIYVDKIYDDFFTIEQRRYKSRKLSDDKSYNLKRDASNLLCNNTSNDNSSTTKRIVSKQNNHIGNRMVELLSNRFNNRNDISLDLGVHSRFTSSDNIPNTETYGNTLLSGGIFDSVENYDVVLTDLCHDISTGLDRTVGLKSLDTDTLSRNLDRFEKTTSTTDTRLKNDKYERSEYIQSVLSSDSMMIAKSRWSYDFGMQASILRTYLYIKMLEKSCELEVLPKLTFSCDTIESVANAVRFKKAHGYVVIKCKNMGKLKSDIRATASEKCVSVVVDSEGKDNPDVLCMSETKSNTLHNGFLDKTKYDVLEKTLNEINKHKEDMKLKITDFFSSELFISLQDTILNECNINEFVNMIVANATFGESLDCSKESFLKAEDAYAERISLIDPSNVGHLSYKNRTQRHPGVDPDARAYSENLSHLLASSNTEIRNFTDMLIMCRIKFAITLHNGVVPMLNKVSPSNVDSVKDDIISKDTPLARDETLSSNYSSDNNFDSFTNSDSNINFDSRENTSTQAKKKCLSPIELVGTFSKMGATDVTSRLFHDSMLSESDLDTYMNELFECRYLSVKVLYQSHDILNAISETTVKMVTMLSEINFVTTSEATMKMNEVMAIVRKFVDNIDALNWPWMFANNEIKKNNGKLQCENFALAESSDDMVLWSHCMVNVLSPGQQSYARNFAKSPLTTRGDTKSQILKKNAGNTKGVHQISKKKSSSNSDVEFSESQPQNDFEVDSAGIKFKRFHTFSSLLFGDDVQGGVYGGHKYSTDVNSRTSFAPVLSSQPADNLRELCEYPWYIATELDLSQVDEDISSVGNVDEYYSRTISEQYISEPQPLIVAHQNKGYGTNKIDKSGKPKTIKKTPSTTTAATTTLSQSQKHSDVRDTILDTLSSEFGSYTKTADSLRMPMVSCFSGIFTGSGNKRLSKKQSNLRNHTLLNINAKYESMTLTKTKSNAIDNGSSDKKKNPTLTVRTNRNILNGSIVKRGRGRPRLHPNTDAGVSKNRKVSNRKCGDIPRKKRDGKNSEQKNNSHINNNSSPNGILSTSAALVNFDSSNNIPIGYGSQILPQMNFQFDTENVYGNTLGLGGVLAPPMGVLNGYFPYADNSQSTASTRSDILPNNEDYFDFSGMFTSQVDQPLYDGTLYNNNNNTSGPAMLSHHEMCELSKQINTNTLLCDNINSDITNTSIVESPFVGQHNTTSPELNNQTSSNSKLQQGSDQSQIPQSTNIKRTDMETYLKNPRVLAGAFFFKMQEKLNIEPEYITTMCELLRTLNTTSIIDICNDFINQFSINEVDVGVYLEFLCNNYPIQHIDEFHIFDNLGTFKKPINQTDDEYATGTNTQSSSRQEQGKQLDVENDLKTNSKNNVGPIKFRNELLKNRFNLKTVLDCLKSGDLPNTFQTSHQLDQYAKDIEYDRTQDVELLSEYFPDLASLEVACFDILDSCDDYIMTGYGVQTPSEYSVNLAKHVHQMREEEPKKQNESKKNSKSKANQRGNKSNNTHKNNTSSNNDVLKKSSSDIDIDSRAVSVKIRDNTCKYPSLDIGNHSQNSSSSDSTSALSHDESNHPCNDGGGDDNVGISNDNVESLDIGVILNTILNVDITPVGKSVRGRPSSSTQFINKPISKDIYEKLEDNISNDIDSTRNSSNSKKYSMTNDKLIAKYGLRNPNLGPNGKKIPKQQRSKQGQVLDVHASLAFLSTCSGVSNFENGIIKDNSYDIDGDGLYFTKKSKSNPDDDDKKVQKSTSSTNKSARKPYSSSKRKRYDFDDTVFQSRLTRLNESHQGILGLIGGWSLNLMPIFANDFNIAVFMRLCKLIQNTKPRKNNFTIFRKMSSYNQTVDDLLKEIPCVPVCVPTGFVCIWDNLIPSGFLRFDVENIDSQITQSCLDVEQMSADELYMNDISYRCRQMDSMTIETSRTNHLWSDMRLPFVGLGFNMNKRSVLDNNLIVDDSYISASNTCLNSNNVNHDEFSQMSNQSEFSTAHQNNNNNNQNAEAVLKTGKSLINLKNVDHSGDLLRRYSKTIYNRLDTNLTSHKVLHFDNNDINSVKEASLTNNIDTGDRSWVHTFDRLNGKVELYNFSGLEGMNGDIPALSLDLSVGVKIPSFFMPSLSQAAITFSETGQNVSNTILVKNIEPSSDLPTISSSQYDRRLIFKDRHTINNIHLNGYYYMPKTKQLTTTSKDARKTMKKMTDSSKNKKDHNDNNLAKNKGIYYNISTQSINHVDQSIRPLNANESHNRETQSPSSTSGIGKISALFGYYCPIGAHYPTALGLDRENSEKNMDYYNLCIPYEERCRNFNLLPKYDIFGKIKSLPSMSITGSALSFLNIAYMFCDDKMKGYTYKYRHTEHSFDVRVDKHTVSQMSSYDDTLDVISSATNEPLCINETITNLEALASFRFNNNAKMTVRKITNPSGSTAEKLSKNEIKVRCTIKKRHGMHISRWVPSNIEYEKRCPIYESFDEFAYKDETKIVGPIKLYDQVGKFWISFNKAEDIPRSLVMDHRFKHYFISYDIIENIEKPKIYDERSYWFSDLDTPLGTVTKLSENSVRYTKMVRNLTDKFQIVKNPEIFEFASKRLQYSSDERLNLLTRLMMRETTTLLSDYMLWLGSCILIMDYCEARRQTQKSLDFFEYCNQSGIITPIQICERAKLISPDFFTNIKKILDNCTNIDNSVQNHNIALDVITAGGRAHDSYFNYFNMNKVW